MSPIPTLWTSPHGHLHRDALRREADALSARHVPPAGPGELAAQLARLRAALRERLRLDTPGGALDVREHGTLQLDGYEVRKISFLGAPGVRVTGSLYVPSGPGPFPAIVNMHGHAAQGKLAEKIQARGHVMALSGFVVLSVDAAGSGERADDERCWSYHGAMRAGELLLTGDTLLGFQVRDNRRAVDVLQSLPFVDPERIGATGASGGGNQTMWLAACDERIKAAVPVVSVGSFQAYVGARNCLCETLPGGLDLAEEWMVLGLIAPRALLVVNALHDQPAFAHAAMWPTCLQAQEVYALAGARDRLDYRLLDMTHGYHRPVVHLLRDWMMRWLADRPAAPDELPDWNALAEEELMCFPAGERPPECSFRFNRLQARENIRRPRPPGPDAARETLARLVGWKNPEAPSVWTVRRTREDGTAIGAVTTSRGIMLPVARSPRSAGRTRVVLSPDGKHAPWAIRAWEESRAAGWNVVAADLPGTGELEWEELPCPGGARFHDTARACLWLGRTLAGEWAEAIAAVCSTVEDAVVEMVADREAAFAALLCRALRPDLEFSLAAEGLPATLTAPGLDSLVWSVPGFLTWGDLPELIALAGIAVTRPGRGNAQNAPL